MHQYCLYFNLYTKLFWLICLLLMSPSDILHPLQWEYFSLIIINKLINFSLFPSDFLFLMSTCFIFCLAACSFSILQFFFGFRTVNSLSAVPTRKNTELWCLWESVIHFLSILISIFSLVSLTLLLLLFFTFLPLAASISSC